MKILMVCLGNICRSPLAEGILQHKIKCKGVNWIVDSASTNGYHTGEPPHHLSIKVAKLHGIDISNQCSRKFVASDFEKYDKIFAMAIDVIEEMKYIAENKFDNSKVSLLLEITYPNKNMDVPDPWSLPESEYHIAFNLIESACEEMVNRGI